MYMVNHASGDTALTNVTLLQVEMNSSTYTYMNYSLSCCSDSGGRKKDKEWEKWRERQEKGGTGRKYEMGKRLKKRKNKLK